MDLAELGKAVAKFAPALGALLPVPGGAAIGAAIASAFGGNIENPQELAQKIQADPHAAIKLAEIQANLQIGMRQADSIDLKTQAYDRKDARGYRDTFTAIFAFIVLLGSFAVSAYILYLVKLGDISNLECTIIGGLITHFLAEAKEVRAYYFGGLIQRAKETLLINK